MTARPKLSLRLVSVVVLLIMAATSVAVTLVVRSLIADQQSRLLSERTNEAGSLITSIFSSVPTTLPVLAEATGLRVGSTSQFTQTARGFISPETNIGALQVAGTVVTVVAGVGGGTSVVGATLTSGQAALAERATSAKGMVSAVVTTPQGPRLDFDVAVGGLVVYEEADITLFRSYRPAPNDPFSELNGALYASTSADPAQLVLATTRHLPLTGAVKHKMVSIGADQWLLLVGSKGPLIGSFASTSPWWILGAGLLASVLATILVETLTRRRSYALALVEERTLALSEATRAAQAANQSKSEFLSRMSHELRTPLNAVLGFAQLLELDQLTDSQQESVGQVIKGGRHLLKLINEVLDISRIDTGTLAMSLEPVLVSEVIHDTLVLLRPLADHRHIELSAEIDPDRHTHVLADRQRLQQILLNLVANGIKYNHDGGSVTVTCEAAEDEQLRITVADTGPGIKTEHLNRIFTPFERLGAERTDIEGTGVGLALSLRLAEAMGGILDVKSTEGQGSRFGLQLPIAEDPLQEHRNIGDHLTGSSLDDGHNETIESHQRRKVLYIEDNPSNVHLVERLLARRGDVELISTMQGRIGVALAHEHHPALILLDLHLPDISGDQVLRQLRDDPTTTATPIVIVSADATERQIQRLLSEGADAYLTKPLDLQRLLAALDEALDQAAPTTTSA